MANRDLTNFRTVIQQVAKQPNQLATAGAQLAEGIIRQGEEAKLTEATSQAQLDLSALQSQYQIDNEGDPMGGIQKYKQDRQKIFDTIGKNVSPLYRRQWEDNSRQISTRNDATQTTWALKQTRANTVAHVNNTMKNSFKQAGSDGQAFGNSDETELDAFVNFGTSMQNLQKFGEDNLGEVTTAGMMETYEEDYVKSFISGVSETNPLKAAALLDNEEVKSRFSDQDQYSKFKKAVNNRALNFQKIAIENEALGALKQSAGIINRPNDKPFTQIEIMELSSKVSAPTKAYLERLGGFKKAGSGTKLSKAEQIAEETKVTEEVFMLAAKDGVSGKELQISQDNILTAVNNGSMSKSDAMFLTNEMVSPYVSQVEENLSQFEFKKDNWFSESTGVGFSQIQNDIEPFLISVNDDDGKVDDSLLSDDQVKFNNNQKIKMYRNYSSALRKQAQLRNIPVADILKQDASVRSDIFRKAQVEAKTNYLTGKYPDLVNMADNMPDKLIGRDGSVIKTGLGNGKATVSVNTPQKRIKLEDANGNFAWKYEDGRIEEIK